MRIFVTTGSLVSLVYAYAFFFFAKSRGAGGFFEKKIKCPLREAIDLESERVRKLFFSVGCIWILVRSEDHKIWPK